MIMNISLSLKLSTEARSGFSPILSQKMFYKHQDINYRRYVDSFNVDHKINGDMTICGARLMVLVHLHLVSKSVLYSLQ